MAVIQKIIHQTSKQYKVVGFFLQLTCCFCVNLPVIPKSLSV